MRIGEVIETSTGGFWAESTTLHELPPLGSLVGVKAPTGDTIFGVVAFGQTAGIDSGRQAVLRGTDEVLDDAIYARHPELTMVLRTTFRTVTVGYMEPSRLMRHYASPCPPPLHYSVTRCTADEVRAFTEEPHYFPMLLAARTEIPAEQVLAAHIRAVYGVLNYDLNWLTIASKQVARLLKRDYDRLITVLEGIDPGNAGPWGVPPVRLGRDAGSEPLPFPQSNNDSDVPF